MKIIYSPSFERQYRKLPLDVKIEAEKKVKIFRQNPFHPKLKTHKLKGPLQGFWSFSINYSYRIVFEFANQDIVYFHGAGDHRVYQ